MAEVTVTIAGRSYRMACDDGQEEHLNRLGDLVDQKIADMRASFGEIGDMRLTVMAAIVIADDLADARKKIAAQDDDSEQVRSHDEAAAAAGEEEASQVADTVNHLAERLEVLAADLRTRLKANAGAESA